MKTTKMKEFEIDILGSAPSVGEIERRNSTILKRSRIFFAVSFFLYAFFTALVFSLLPFIESQFTVATQDGVAVISMLSGFVFLLLGFDVRDELEEFISNDECIELANAITSDSDVSLYRDKVVERGRKFLRSEFVAIGDFLAEKKCREIYCPCKNEGAFD